MTNNHHPPDIYIYTLSITRTCGNRNLLPPEPFATGTLCICNSRGGKWWMTLVHILVMLYKLNIYIHVDNTHVVVVH